MKKIIWITSYPKSGNTYVRSFLAHYLFSKNLNLDFDLLKKIPKFEKKGTFAKVLNKKLLNDDLNFTEYSLNVQKKLIKKFNQQNLIFKTHHFFGELNNHVFTDKNHTLLFIYIVRDPREVLVSYASHRNMSIDELLDYFVSNNILYKIETETIINWALHYRSWKSFKSVPSLFLKYEDLIQEPKKNFIKLVTFLSNYVDIEVDKKIVEKTIEIIKFDKLKKLENESGFHEAPRKNSFFRSGKINSWKKILTKDQIKKVEDAFHKNMKELGYIK